MRDHIIHEMRAYGFDMWSRAAREISRAYAREGYPLRAFGELSPPVEVLRIYSQPDDPSYLKAQLSFAEAHPSV